MGAGQHIPNTLVFVSSHLLSKGVLNSLKQQEISSFNDSDNFIQEKLSFRISVHIYCRRRVCSIRQRGNRRQYVTGHNVMHVYR